MIRWRVCINDGVVFSGRDFVYGEEIIARAEDVADISYGLEFLGAV